MHIPAFQAAVFALFVVPIWIYTFYVDMKTKRIANLTVWMFISVFIVLGAFTMPFMDYLWRYVHWVYVMGIGLALYAIRQVGAGDVKMAAAVAPLFHPDDLHLLLYIVIAALLATLTGIAIAKSIPALRDMAPHWAAWKTSSDPASSNVGLKKQRTLPMGPGIGLVVSTYLAMGIWLGQ